MVLDVDAQRDCYQASNIYLSHNGIIKIYFLCYNLAIKSE